MSHLHDVYELMLLQLATNITQPNVIALRACQMLCTRVIDIRLSGRCSRHNSTHCINTRVRGQGQEALRGNKDHPGRQLAALTVGSTVSAALSQQQHRTLGGRILGTVGPHR